MDSSWVDELNDKVTVPENEYMGMDGFLRCKVCGEKVQTDIDVFGEKKRVRCICKCREAEISKNTEADRAEEIKRKKQICFSGTNMLGWCFENDDRKNAEISDAMIKYTEQFQEFLKEGKGLLLYGGVGTGKTFYAACIANRLIDKGYTALMTNFARITNKVQSMYEGKQDYIDSLNRYDLMVLDDLGAESKSDYRQEMVFNIIDSRYRAGLPFIVTTNLTAEEIKRPQDIEKGRVYDRILERCFPLEVSGQSRRRLSVKETYYQTKDLLGL